MVHDIVIITNAVEVRYSSRSPSELNMVALLPVAGAAVAVVAAVARAAEVATGGAAEVATGGAAAAGAAASTAFSATKALGVVAGVLGIISFAESHFPKAAETPNAAFRVQVGLDTEPFAEHEVLDAGGRLPDARNFNAMGIRLGTAVNDHVKVEQGTFKDFKLVQDVNQQPVYTLFTANKDAICIAYITTIWPDGQKYAWTGGFGQLCDKDC